MIHNYVEATPYGVLALDSFSNNRRRRREMMSTVNGRPRIVLRTQRRTVYLIKARADDRCEAGTDSTRRFGKILGCVRGKRFKTKKRLLSEYATSTIVQKRDSVLLPWSRVSRVYFEHAHSALSVIRPVRLSCVGNGVHM